MSKWEAQIVKWESEPYTVFADSLSELIDQFPPVEEVSNIHIWQIGNPLAA